MRERESENIFNIFAFLFYVCSLFCIRISFITTVYKNCAFVSVSLIVTHFKFVLFVKFYILYCCVFRIVLYVLRARASSIIIIVIIMFSSFVWACVRAHTQLTYCSTFLYPTESLCTQRLTNYHARPINHTSLTLSFEKYDPTSYIYTMIAHNFL